MALWCPTAMPLVRATLRNFRLVFRCWADIVPSPGDRVQGAIYSVGPEDLGALDELHECPVLYHRVRVTVWTTDGPLDALAYRMNAGQPVALPDPDYLDLLLQGYDDWELDADMLKFRDARVLKEQLSDGTVENGAR